MIRLAILIALLLTGCASHPRMRWQEDGWIQDSMP
jgi:hypothetical protein